MSKWLGAGGLLLVVCCLFAWRTCDGAPVEPGTTKAGVGGAQPKEKPEVARHFNGQRNVEKRPIAGIVLIDGQPAVGATVTVRWTVSEAGGTVPMVVTGADGRFDLGAFPADEYTVTATARHRTPAIRKVDLRNPILNPPSDKLILELAVCSNSIIGTVFDASGGPIQGAQVTMERSVGGVTDRDGTYEVCLPRGEHTIKVSADGYGSIVFTITAEGELRRDVTLVPSVSVVGRAVAASDRSDVAGALIGAWSLDRAPMRPADAMTYADENGRFTLQSLAPGRYVVWGTARGLRGSVSVMVQAGGTANVVVEFQAVTVASGRVVGGSGEPAAGVRVTAESVDRKESSPPATTQRDGSFTLDEVPIGQVAFLVADHVVESPKHLAIDASGRDGIEIRVVALASISGRVTHQGAAVAGAIIYSAEAPRNRATTDPNGNYRISGLLAGQYSLQADAYEGRASAKMVKVASSEQVRGFDFELDNTAGIAGVVVDQGDRPLSNAFITWTRAGSSDVLQGSVDNRGRFSITGLPGADTYRASIQTIDQQKPLTIISGDREIQIVSNVQRVEGLRLKVQFSRLTISGTVLTDTGEPVPDARVDALAAPNEGVPVFHTWLRLPTANTTIDGSFSLSGLADGKYRVRVRSADGSEAISAPVEAGTTGMVLRLVTSSRIEVTLEGFKSTPTVAAQAAQGPLQGVFGEVDGQTARISGLVPGKYIVTAYNPRESAAVLVALESKPVHITLRSEGSRRVRGVVKDFTSLEPVPGMNCLYFPAVEGVLGPEAAWQMSSAPRTGADGTFEVEMAPAGSGAFYCYDPTSGTSTARAFLGTSNEPSVSELRSVRLRPPGEGGIGVELDQGYPVRVVSVRDNGPAAKAGVKAGDQIIALNGRPVEALSKGAIEYWFRSQTVGSTIEITVGHSTETRVVTVVVAHRLGG